MYLKGKDALLGLRAAKVFAWENPFTLHGPCAGVECCRDIQASRRIGQVVDSFCLSNGSFVWSTS